jgi:hypothetical protein
MGLNCSGQVAVLGAAEVSLFLLMRGIGMAVSKLSPGIGIDGRHRYRVPICIATGFGGRVWSMLSGACKRRVNPNGKIFNCGEFEKSYVYAAIALIACFACFAAVLTLALRNAIGIPNRVDIDQCTGWNK